MCTCEFKGLQSYEEGTRTHGAKHNRLFEWLQKISITYKTKTLKICPFTESICWAWRDGSVRVGCPGREPEFSYKGHACGSQLPAAPAPESPSLPASMGSQCF